MTAGLSSARILAALPRLLSHVSAGRIPCVSLSLFSIPFSFFKIRFLIFIGGINIWMFTSISISFFYLQLFSSCTDQTANFHAKHHTPVLCTPSGFASVFAAKRNICYELTLHSMRFPLIFLPFTAFQNSLSWPKCPRVAILFGLQWHEYMESNPHLHFYAGHIWLCFLLVASDPSCHSFHYLLD